jgi:hypothetical protein
VNRQQLTCRLKGHMWQGAGGLPSPGKISGQYIVHRRCFRCGKYERRTRQAVIFLPNKEN